MSDMRQLYQEVILDHNRKPRNFGSILSANRHADGHNPLCGDHIKLSMNVLDDKIEAIAFEGEGCAICKASASMMTSAVKGKPVQEAELMVEEFRSMATGTLDPESKENHLGKLKVFAGSRPCRHASSARSCLWHTLHAALNPVLSLVEGAEPSISTEGEADPVPGTGIGEE